MTGLALITVDRTGENAIVVAAGANSAVTIDDAVEILLERFEAVLVTLGGRGSDLHRRGAAVVHAPAVQRPGAQDSIPTVAETHAQVEVMSGATTGG